MARYTKDPWAKKSQKGMKSLGKITKLAVGATALGASAVSHQQKSIAKKSDVTPAQMSPLSGVLMVSGAIIGMAIGIIAIRGFGGIILGIPLGLLFIIIGALLGSNITSSTEKKSIGNADMDSNESSKMDLPIEKVVVVKSLIDNLTPYADIEKQLENITATEEKNAIIKKALNQYYREMADSLEIPKSSEDYTENLVEHFSLPDVFSLSNKDYIDYVKFLNVQDILNGITPKRVSYDTCPINLAKDEIIIWVFNNVVCYEEVEKRTNVGATRGISVKLAKGVYYRVGAFKGEPVMKSQLKAVAGGDMILTNRCIYLYSKQKSLKYPYSKILAYVPFEDGLGIQPDKTVSKTIYFSGIDGRYAYNIVTNIGNIN